MSNTARQALEYERVQNGGPRTVANDGSTGRPRRRAAAAAAAATAAAAAATKHESGGPVDSDTDDDGPVWKLDRPDRADDVQAAHQGATSGGGDDDPFAAFAMLTDIAMQVADEKEENGAPAPADEPMDNDEDEAAHIKQLMQQLVQRARPKSSAKQPFIIPQWRSHGVRTNCSLHSIVTLEQGKKLLRRTFHATVRKKIPPVRRRRAGEDVPRRRSGKSGMRGGNRGGHAHAEAHAAIAAAAGAAGGLAAGLPQVSHLSGPSTWSHAGGMPTLPGAPFGFPGLPGMPGALGSSPGAPGAPGVFDPAAAAAAAAALYGWHGLPPPPPPPVLPPGHPTLPPFRTPAYPAGFFPFAPPFGGGPRQGRRPRPPPRLSRQQLEQYWQQAQQAQQAIQAQLQQAGMQLPIMQGAPPQQGLTGGAGLGVPLTMPPTSPTEQHTQAAAAQAVQAQMQAAHVQAQAAVQAAQAAHQGQQGGGAGILEAIEGGTMKLDVAPPPKAGSAKAAVVRSGVAANQQTEAPGATSDGDHTETASPPSEPNLLASETLCAPAVVAPVLEATQTAKTASAAPRPPAASMLVAPTVDASANGDGRECAC